MSRGSARFAVRCCVLVLAAIFALPVLPWTWAPLLPPALSPFLTIGSTLAARSLSVAGALGIPMLVIALLNRRWFCRQACPVGLIVEVIGWIRPAARARGAKLPPIGQWVALVTFAGACLGYPLLLWADPLALFSGFFGVFHHGARTAQVISAIGLPIVLLVSLIWPSAWCAKICPLGATQDLLALPRRLLRSTTPSRDEPPAQVEQPLARRTILTMGLGAAWAAATLEFARSGVRKALRPPGAIAERNFTGVCVRCGNCVRACPTGIIRPDLGRHGVAGFLAPVVRFEKGFCLQTCRRCTEVCPSGAISRLSLEQKCRTRIGLAQVDMSHCLLSEDKECSICVNRCPYQAITLAFNREDYISIPRIAREKCPGCGACELACPTSPKAIRVHP